MDVRIFSDANGDHALSSDESGAILPEHLGPWTYQEPFRLNRSVDDEAEGIRLIEQHGYVCFD